MNFSITESQKKLMMLLFTILLSVLIITMGVQSVYAQTKLSKETLEGVQLRADEMRNVIEDVTVEANYDKLKKESKISFEQNYRTFKANEKIEEIILDLGLQLSSIQISDYRPVDAGTYESSIVQPKNKTEYDKMQADMAGELINLFLVSQITIGAEMNDTQYLQVVNAINNIPPDGPGDMSKERYCLQMPSVVFAPSGEEVREQSLTINMYGMVPPPIEEEATP